MFMLATADIAMSFNMVLAPTPSAPNDEAIANIVLARLYPKNPLYVTNKHAFSLMHFCVFIFNLVMTTATAGRIWWISRSTSSIFGKQVTKRYNTAVAILIETGAIYCISLLLMLNMPHKPYNLIFQALSIRLVAIIPTLMIVQVELGRQNYELSQDPEIFERSSRTTTINSTSSSNVPPDNQNIPEKNMRL
ncbi:hypothetical protein BDZ94DRAFT_1367715 [Collybia nuda]|uniref:Uncharacterized protein n=1 Tax=Collybia nuda TaxID=64659 RepID=A0A9P5Y4P4_9AGAR|nr:hypothetical protein BDZ94DRAFT_1367715 [Collybia nuda]